MLNKLLFTSFVFHIMVRRRVPGMRKKLTDEYCDKTVSNLLLDIKGDRTFRDMEKDCEVSKGTLSRYISGSLKPTLYITYVLLRMSLLGSNCLGTVHRGATAERNYTFALVLHVHSVSCFNNSVCRIRTYITENSDLYFFCLQPLRKLSVSPSSRRLLSVTRSMFFI